MRTHDVEIIFLHTLPIHSAMVASQAAVDVMGGTVEEEHFVSDFFRAFHKLPGEVNRISVLTRTS